MQPLNDITIIVAEDERPVRMLLRVVLESAGARVLEAEHGVVALRLLDLHPEVDALCTDVNMPIMDGLDLARAVRDTRPDMPIIACTATDIDASYPALGPLIDAVVQKPFVPSALVHAVGTAVARRRDNRLVAS